MDDISRTASHLRSRYSMASDMAEAAYWAIRADGLRLPPRRVIAGMARISEATLSRRFKGESTEEVLVLALVEARRQTYPVVYAWSPDWEPWLPRTEEEVQDVRVWSACLQLAPTSPSVASAVAAVWHHERERLSATRPQLGPIALDALHALISGLSLRISLDSTFDHATAVSALQLVADALHA